MGLRNVHGRAPLAQADVQDSAADFLGAGVASVVGVDGLVGEEVGRQLETRSVHPHAGDVSARDVFQSDGTAQNSLGANSMENFGLSFGLK